MFKQVRVKNRLFEGLINNACAHMTFVIVVVKKIGNVCGYDSDKKRRIFLIFG